MQQYFQSKYSNISVKLYGCLWIVFFIIIIIIIIIIVDMWEVSKCRLTSEQNLFC